MAKKKITKGLIKEREKAVKKAFNEEYKEAQRRLEKYCKNSDHGRPTTRREFLNSGMLSMQAWMLGPAIGSLVGGLKANAAECPDMAVAAGMPGVIHVHTRGGQAIMEAGVPRQTNGGEVDPGGFSNMGLGNNPTFLQPFANDARLPNIFNAGRGFLNGVLDTTDNTTRQNCIQISCPVRDNGDSTDPEKLFLGLLERLGLTGKYLGFTGDDNAATGTNGAPNSVFGINSTQPLVVRRQEDILQAVQLSGALQNLNNDQQISLARLIEKLSLSQTQKLSGLSGAKNMADAVECATGQNVQNLVEGAGGLTPPAAIAQIWNNFQDENFGTGRIRSEAFGWAVYQAVTGNSAGCVIEMGGYDIHNDAGDGRDFQEQGEYATGRVVGKALQTAAALNQKICVVLTTNGSNNNNGGDENSPFNSDSSSYSVSHMWLFDPAGAPATVGNLNAQIIGVTANGQVDRNTGTPFATPSGSSAALFYNYAIFAGKEAEVDAAMGGNALSAAEKAYARRVA